MKQFGEVVTCSVLSAPFSRASIFLNYPRSQIPSDLARDSCKVLSPQLSKISRMASKSARSIFDFLRLAGELAENCGHVGVNFSEAVAAGAEFCVSSKSSASVSSRSALSVSSGDRSSTNCCLSEAFSVLKLPKSVCNPIFQSCLTLYVTADFRSYYF